MAVRFICVFLFIDDQGNRSLRTLMIKSCGLLRQEVKEIEAFITERESTSINVLVQALFVNEEDIFDFSNRDSNYHRRNFMKRFETMPWRDQLEFVRLIVGEKTRLEAMRLKDERYFTEVKYIPPPIPRPRMPTKGNAGERALHYCERIFLVTPLFAYDIIAGLDMFCFIC